MVLTRQMAARLKAQEARDQLSKQKPCMFFKEGAGFCNHEDKCYYSHACDPNIKACVQEACCICYETPSAYGLLENCSHVFCLECIKKWRKHSIYEVEDVNTSNQRLCPVCRGLSRFILPLNYLPNAKQKDKLMDDKKAWCAQQPCKYFQDFLPGKTFVSDPLLFYCPYFNDCPYLHEWNSEPFTFTPAMIARQKDWLDSQYDDLWEGSSIGDPAAFDELSDDDMDYDLRYEDIEMEPEEDGTDERNAIEIDSESEQLHRAIRASLMELSDTIP